MVPPVGLTRGLLATRPQGASRAKALRCQNFLPENFTNLRFSLRPEYQ